MLDRRVLMGPMTGWWLSLDGYRPMVRSGTWLNLSRVDGVEELHLFRIEPLGLAPPPKPKPAPPPAEPVQLPEVPFFIRLFLKRNGFLTALLVPSLAGSARRCGFETGS